MTTANDFVCYHALYLLLAHCAAFIATIGLLINIGLASAITKQSQNRKFTVVSVIFVFLGSLLFLWRSYFYASIVDRMLPPAYLRELSTVWAGPHMFIVAGGSSFVLAALIIAMAFSK